MIAVRHWERAKGLTRIEFVAGVRALADYRRANKTARDVAALIVPRVTMQPNLQHAYLEENKELHRRLRALEEIAARVEAEELLRAKEPSPMMSVPPAVAGGSDRGAVKDSRRGLSAQRDTPGPEPQTIPDSAGVIEPRIIAKVFENRDAESLKHLAQALISHDGVIALLGSKDHGTARLVFARSADASGDMNALMRQACEMLDGRGGGRPDMAQGGGKRVDRLEEAINNASTGLTQK